ncbi:MAG: MBL fold metallo-hydrolase [Bacillota bacterium]|jgi:phosphoribosyl 1,2-cyclic phosphodiesterase
MNGKGNSSDFIKFLGTAGARVVVSKQLRSSGGMWICLGGKNIFFDPGPGALVRCWDSNPPMDPSSLDAIVLTHRHLDHSGDMNAMVEAMVEGGFTPHGEVFAPGDALNGPEPILFKYLRRYLQRINTITEGSRFYLSDIEIEFPVRHLHPVETYGVKLKYQDKSISYIVDTRFFPELIESYRAQVLIISMTFMYPFYGNNVFHLSSKEIVPLIKGINPKIVFLTHFGRRVVEVGPEIIAGKLEEETGIRVCAAQDGMEYSIN